MGRHSVGRGLRKTMYKKVVWFFEGHRLLDGYTGVLGLTLHYRVLATYSPWFHLLYLYLHVWKLKVCVDFTLRSPMGGRVTLAVRLPVLFRREFVVRKGRCLGETG